MFGIRKLAKRKKSNSRKPRTSYLDTNKSSKTKRSVKNNRPDNHKRKDYKSNNSEKDSDGLHGLQHSKREREIEESQNESKSYVEIPSLTDIHKMDSGELIHMNLNTDETMVDNFCSITSVFELMRHFERSPSIVPVRKSKSNSKEPQKLCEKSLEEENKWIGSNGSHSVEGTIKQERDKLKQYLEEAQLVLQKTQQSKSTLDALKGVKAKSLILEKKKVQYQNDCERYKRERDQVSRENAEINNQCSKMKHEIKNLRKEYEQEKTLRKKVEDVTNQRTLDMRTMLDQAVTKGEELRNKVEELEEKLRTQKESSDMLERLKDENNELQHTLKLSQQDVKEKLIEIKVLKEKLRAADNLSKSLEHKKSVMQRRIHEMSEQLLSQKENSGVKTRKLESKLFLLQAELDTLQDIHKKQIQKMKLSQRQVLAEQRKEIRLKLQEEFEKQRSVPSKPMEDLVAVHQKMKRDNLELKTEAATLEELLWDERMKVNQFQIFADLQKKAILENVWEQTWIQSKRMKDTKREVRVEVEHDMGQQPLRIKPRRSSVPETEIRRSNISSELQRRGHKKKVKSSTASLRDLLIQRQDSLRLLGRSQGDLYVSCESDPEKAKWREKIRKKAMVYKRKRHLTSKKDLLTSKKDLRLHGGNSSYRRMWSSYDSKTDQSPSAIPLPKFGESDSGGLSWGRSSGMFKSINCNTSPETILTRSRQSEQSLEESGDESSSELLNHLPWK